jgi:2-haloacid dehalogenase
MTSARVITLDCYGTLIDTRPITEMIKGIAEAHGLDREVFVSAFEAEEVRQMQAAEFRPLVKIVGACFKHCGETLGVGSLEQCEQPVLEQYRQLKPFPEVIDVLHRLSSQFDLYIMSNSQSDVIDSNVRALKTRFKGVFVAEELQHYKPDLRFFRAVAERLELGKPHVFHVHVAAGFWWDIIPASQLGWNRIWVNRRKGAGDSKYRPYFETFDLAGCVERIEELEKRIWPQNL